MFLTGPGVVREVMGEDVGAAELGGTGVHERNGVCHFVAETDADAALLARDLLDHLPQHAASARRAGVRRAARGRATRARSCPATSARVYDVRDVMRRARRRRAPARVGAALGAQHRLRRSRASTAAPVGVVANQPRYLGGVLDADSATKAARFVRTCNAFGLPLSCSSTRRASCPARARSAAA